GAVYPRRTLTWSERRGAAGEALPARRQRRQVTAPLWRRHQLQPDHRQVGGEASRPLREVRGALDGEAVVLARADLAVDGERRIVAEQGVEVALPLQRVAAEA